jgi:hypothetical protein
MLVEFLGYDDQLRVFTAIPFSIGLFFIAVYYLYILPREKRKEKGVAVSVEIPKL